MVYTPGGPLPPAAGVLRSGGAQSGLAVDKARRV